MRDSKNRVSITNWLFNGWAKYDNWRDDNAIPVFISKRTKIPQVEPGIVLEGGSIDVNGAGLLLTTEECLLSETMQVRNPGFTRARLGALLRRLSRNPPHSSGSNAASPATTRTATSTTWPASSTPTPSSPSPNRIAPKPTTNRCAKTWPSSRQTDLRIATLPMPAPVWFDGQRLPASYANFYIANGLVLVPVFNDPMDRIALTTLARLFPTRQIVPIYSRDLVLGLGTLHCMTMQQPAP